MRYELIGELCPVVEFSLEQGETICLSHGGMRWMDDELSMETKAGGIGGFFKKAFTKTSPFQTYFTADAAGKIAAGLNVPGLILPFSLNAGQSIILQKNSFIASDPSIEFNVHFQKKISSGLFSGEGFILQKLTATQDNSLAFAQVSGSFVKRHLVPGQKLIVESGAVVGFTEGISMSVQTVKGLKNKVFGGEGFFNTVLDGLGDVWLQTFDLQGFIKFIAAATGSSTGAVAGAAIASSIASSNNNR